ncbi:MAG: SprT family zinc-dependent metalloprotease [Archaeoglobaceae archaeon]
MDWFASGFQALLTIERKQVKGINIRVTWNGKVIVSVPKEINDEMIERVLKRKTDWILRKLEEMKVRREQLPLFYQFVDEETFWILGRPTTLKVINSSKNGVNLKGEKLIVRVTENDIDRVKQIIVKWMQEQTLKIVNEKVEKFAKILGVKPERIEVKNWKDKWGLCYINKRVLKFNWRLVQLPESLIDYVVIHELAHLRYQKHDGNFWTLISKTVPDWKTRHKELKKWTGVLMW